MIGIYSFRNKYNQKRYIGQSTDINCRYRKHLSNAKYNCVGPFYEDLRKYGIDSFDFSVLIECPKEQLDYWEKFYIKYYCSNIYEYGDKYGYNRNPGGDGGFTNHASYGMLGKHQSEHQKHTVSLKLTGREFSEEHKQKLRKPKEDTSKMYKHTGDHWYHLNEDNVLLKPDKIPYYESLGYVKGRYRPKKGNYNRKYNNWYKDQTTNKRIYY